MTRELWCIKVLPLDADDSEPVRYLSFNRDQVCVWDDHEEAKRRAAYYNRTFGTEFTYEVAGVSIEPKL